MLPEEGFIQDVSRRGSARDQQDALISMILKGSNATEQVSGGSRLTSCIFTSEMLRMLSDSRES